jgi:hypothetical protein
MHETIMETLVAKMFPGQDEAGKEFSGPGNQGAGRGAAIT